MGLKSSIDDVLSSPPSSMNKSYQVLRHLPEFVSSKDLLIEYSTVLTKFHSGN